MALVKCNDCENDVSTSASACSKCGCPAEKIKGTDAEVKAAHVAKVQADAAASQIKVNSVPGVIIIVIVVSLISFFIFNLVRNESGSNINSSESRCDVYTCLLAGNNRTLCKNASDCPGIISMTEYRRIHTEAGCVPWGTCKLGGMFYMGRDSELVCVITSGG